MRLLKGGAALAAAIALTLPATAAGEASSYQGGPTHDGLEDAGLRSPLYQRWRVGHLDDPSYPVVAGGLVLVLQAQAVVGDYGARLLAYDAITGRRRWSRDLAFTYWWAAVAYDQGRVFVETNDGDVIALDAETGRQVWRKTIDEGSDSMPVAAGGVVYVPTYYHLSALDERTGRVIWSFPLPYSLPMGGPPVVSDSRVFLRTCEGTIYAVDASTGIESFAIPGASDCPYRSGSLSLSGGRLYAPSRDDLGRVLDAKDGHVLRRLRFDALPAVKGDLAVLVYGTRIQAVNVASGAVRWSARLHGLLTAPVISDRLAIVGADEGLVAFDLATGRVLWRSHPLADPILHVEEQAHVPLGLAAGDGALFVPTLQGLFAFDATFRPTPFAIQQAFGLEGEMAAEPAITEERVGFTDLQGPDGHWAAVRARDAARDDLHDALRRLTAVPSWMGAIDGDRAVVQVSADGSHAAIALADLRRHHTRVLRWASAGARWNWGPSIAGHWLVYVRGDSRYPHAIVAADLHGHHHERILAAADAKHVDVGPGGSGGRFTTYEICRIRSGCNVVRVDLSSGRRARVSIPYGFGGPYAPAALADGSVYAVASGPHCGDHVVIFRWQPHRRAVPILALPPGKDAIELAASRRADGVIEIAFTRVDCKHRRMAAWVTQDRAGFKGVPLAPRARAKAQAMPLDRARLSAEQRPGATPTG